MGAGKGKQRRAQVMGTGSAHQAMGSTGTHQTATPPKKNSFLRQKNYGAVKLVSEEKMVRGEAFLQERDDYLALVHMISLRIDDDAPGMYNGLVDLETHVEKQGILIENGIFLHGNNPVNQFSSRNDFQQSLEAALRGREPALSFTDGYSSQRAFVPAVGDDEYMPGSQLLLLINNPEKAENLRKRVRGRDPSLRQYREDQDVYLTLSVLEAESINEALLQEAEHEEEYDAILRERAERAEEERKLIVPDLTSVSF